MSEKKPGANGGDQNFIRKCAEGGNDWSVQRISAHLNIRESVVQEFYDHFSGKTASKSEPKEKKSKAKKKKGKATAEEDFS